MENKTNFEKLTQVNVNEHTERKPAGQGRTLTYLSWAWAWDYFKRAFPDAKYEITHWDGKPYLFDPQLGYMCETQITAGGETHCMWLPVMDSGNNAMKAEPYSYTTKRGNVVEVAAATMFDINTTIMRCLTKNMAMFGLGLYIYGGEDVPQTPFEPMTAEQRSKLLEMGANFDTLCKYLKVQSPDQISVEMADALIKAKEQKDAETKGD